MGARNDLSRRLRSRAGAKRPAPPPRGAAAAFRAQGIEAQALRPSEACEREPTLKRRGYRAVLFLAGEISAHVGLKVPVVPVRGQMFWTVPRPPLMRSVVLSGKVFVLQRIPGHIVAGASTERVGFDKRIVPKTIAELHRRAAAPIPSLASVKPWELARFSR